jgi:hypothetical protein
METILQNLRRVPFVPFQIEVASGRTYLVVGLGNCITGPTETLVANPLGDDPDDFEDFVILPNETIVAVTLLNQTAIT